MDSSKPVKYLFFQFFHTGATLTSLWHIYLHRPGWSRKLGLFLDYRITNGKYTSEDGDNVPVGLGVTEGVVVAVDVEVTGVGVPVSVGGWEATGVSVDVGEFVCVGVGVFIDAGVFVCVGEGVIEGVAVLVLVGVGVLEPVGVGVFVDVGVFVCVGVDVFVLVAVGVLVSVAVGGGTTRPHQVLQRSDPPEAVSAYS
jgi:hypothetical protein